MRIRQWLLFGLAVLLFACGADVQRQGPYNDSGATQPDPGATQPDPGATQPDPGTTASSFQPGLQYEGSVAFERSVP